MEISLKRPPALVATALVLAVASAGAETPAPAPRPLLPARDLLADAAILERAYEELHPGLYRYNTPAGMDAAFAALRAELGRDQTLAEAYRAFSVFLAKVRCGHTYANFFNQTEDIAHELFEKPGRLPFYFRWLDRKMVVTRDFSGDPRLVPGTEVLAIRGTPVSQVLDRLLTVARADGGNDAKRVAYLEVRGESRYEAFDVYYPLFYPWGEGPAELLVRPPGGEAVTVRVPLKTYAERFEAVKAAEEAHEGSGPLWDLRFPDERTAVLRMPSWVTYNSKWDWKRFLDETFAELARRQTPVLVIDLRGNEGGTGVGDVLLSKLSGKDLRLSAVERRVRYRKVPDDLVPYLDTWDKSFRDWGDSAVPSLVPGFFRLTKYDDDERGNLIRGSEKPYAGKTFVLVGASNSSATFEFARDVKQFGVATLVGQTTGGNRRGINGGAFFFLRLPHSKIEADLPLIGQFPTSEQPDAGIEPDVRVEPSATDVAKGVDAEMAAVASLSAKP